MVLPPFMVVRIFLLLAICTLLEYILIVQISVEALSPLEDTVTGIGESI